ncbi:MAG: NUDIX domain-containing protein [Candidatus Thorarchaeota archaeon]
MNERVKIYAYITHGTRLLVFEERGFPEGGIQIPGGTPEPEETPQDAALREAIEETGLEALRYVRYLGEAIFDVSIYGIDEIHRRKFYHIVCDGTPPEKWNHEEVKPSIRTENTPEHIIFDLYWWDLRHGIPNLQSGFDAKLSDLLEYLDFDS